MSQHNDQLCSGFLRRILEASEYVRINDASRHPCIKRVTVVQIEDVLDRDPRIDAADDRCVWVLALNHQGYLDAVILVVTSRSGYKPGIAILQLLQRLLRSHLRLRLL